MNLLHFPDFYKIGIVISIFIGLIFFVILELDFRVKAKRSEALNKLQEVISKEYN